MSQSNSLVNEIASHCVARLTAKFATQVDTMSTAELRGFVRAQSAGVVRQAFEEMTLELSLTPAQSRDLLHATLERAISLTVRELQPAPRTIPILSPHVATPQRRLAA